MRLVYTGKELKRDFPEDYLESENNDDVRENKLYIVNETSLMSTKNEQGHSVLNIKVEQVELSEETIEFVSL